MASASLFEYQYRDAANFKSSACLRLDGHFSEQDKHDLVHKLEGGTFFIAEQVGIPPLYEELWQLSGGPTTDDHAFHEFVELREATEEEVRELPVWGTLDELLQAFQSVKEWDVTLSPNCAT